MSRTKYLLVYSFVIGVWFIFLDGIFHSLDTPTKETLGYYIFGLVGVTLIVFTLLRYFKLTVLNILYASSIWTIIFTIYYRGYELLYSQPFISRTPEIIFPLTTRSSPLLLGLIWFIVHTSALFIPLMVFKYSKIKV